MKTAFETNKQVNPTNDTANLKPILAEVGTGEPGYRWITKYIIVGPDGAEYFPGFTKAEARAFCKAKGWKLAIL